MSLKPVELQIALPRTIENSRNQQIQQNQSSLQNALDGERLSQETTIQEQTVIESEENARAEMRDRQHGQGTAGEGRQGKRSAEDAESPSAAPHPYKGHRLDIKM